MDNDTRDGRAHPPSATYRAAFQAYPAICLVTDQRGVVVDANRTAIEFFNVERRLLVGKPLLFFVARRDTRSFREHVRNLDRHDELETVVVQLRPRGGSPRPMQLTVQRAQAHFFWVGISTEAHASPSVARQATSLGGAASDDVAE
jgi:PAS domain S-box-containing protein